MKKILFVLVLLVSLYLTSGTASAVDSLKIAPQRYDATLQKSEVKKGFIDISNPTNTSVRLKLEVQAFRQIDDQGSLEFFDSEQFAAGVKLDFNTLTVGPSEAYRVYFLLDGSKLPEGDSFGAIFASTIPAEGAGARQSTRVGTLLLLQNGTPTSRAAEITSFAANFLQVGESLSAKITVHNPGDPKKSTGFVPSISVATAPYGSTSVKGPLVFAGRTRSVDFAKTGNYFGPMWFGASASDSSRGQLIFAVTGYWRWVGPIMIIALLVILVLFFRMIRTSRRRKK